MSAEPGSVGGQLHLPFCLDRIPSFSYSVCGRWLWTALISKGKLWPLIVSPAALQILGDTASELSGVFVSAYNQGHCSLSAQAGRGQPGRGIIAVHLAQVCAIPHKDGGMLVLPPRPSPMASSVILCLLFQCLQQGNENIAPNLVRQSGPGSRQYF